MLSLVIDSPGFILVVDHKKLADIKELKAGSQRAVCSLLFRAVKLRGAVSVYKLKSSGS